MRLVPAFTCLWYTCSERTSNLGRLESVRKLSMAEGMTCGPPLLTLLFLFLSLLSSLSCCALAKLKAALALIDSSMAEISLKINQAHPITNWGLLCKVSRPRVSTKCWQKQLEVQCLAITLMQNLLY